MNKYPDAKWLAASDAARLLGIAVNTLRLWADTGKIKVTKTESGMRLFDKKDVEATMARLDAQRAAR